MPSTENTYRIAAREHLARAQDQLGSGSYFLAHYLSGLAVECHLRAWLLRRTKKFDSRHDLEHLARESGFYEVVPSERASDFSAVLTTVNERWRSNHRYYSERQLLNYLTEIKAEFKARGERWKNLARTLLNCAYEIVNEGEAKWNRK
ncbi:MAG: HEPN domain-containing protein [Armatimonadota bacterium]|nr:HEPN domain-containing protein [Armatimonadota bacterium]